MRRLALLFPLLLACETPVAAPGEPIGTFAFDARYVEITGEGCPFRVSPSSLSFTASLSWDPATREAWMQVGNSIRPGRLEGATFHVTQAPDDSGKVRAIPRSLRGCDCAGLFREEVDGTVLRSVADECEELLPAAQAGCPGVAEDGSPDWGACGGVCGRLVELVEPDREECLCEEEPFDAGCRIVYSLTGVRTGAAP